MHGLLCQVIVSSRSVPLSYIMRDFKKHTSKALVKEIELMNESRKEWLLRAFNGTAATIKHVKHYKVWQDGNHPIQLDSAKLLEEKLQYIHMNPVESEIVDETEFYWYSSACVYAGKKGLLKLDMLE